MRTLAIFVAAVAAMHAQDKAGWPQQRQRILANMQLVMGDLPGQRVHALAIKARAPGE